eukprot:GCRY01002561.1.p1 GENE.GCRY01002561.1~~GCRY01002561.1.p1  ORF type:complete len:267 (+),score=33.97 GCRY01002561.1:159-959(+)
MRERLRIGFHIVSFLLSVYPMMFLYMEGATNHLRFFVLFTQWTGVACVIYFLVALFQDHHLKAKILKNAQEEIALVHGLCLYTAQLMVTITAIIFWVLFFVDKKLILANDFDEKYPQYISHLQHTVVVALIWIEALFIHVEKFKRISLREKITAGLVVCMTYGVLTLSYMALTAKYPYPFLKGFRGFDHYILLTVTGAAVVVTVSSLNNWITTLLRALLPLLLFPSPKHYSEVEKHSFEERVILTQKVHSTAQSRNLPSAPVEVEA